MQQSILARIKMFLDRRRRSRYVRWIARCLCCIVVFITTYVLILPAITMEQQAFCGKEEHVHSDLCTDAFGNGILQCTPEKLGLHVHSSGCYGENGAVNCGQAYYIVHQHNALCFDSDGCLICVLPERGQHVHTDACYTPGETVEAVFHLHSNACYIPEKQELQCTEEEREGHTHDAFCYDTDHTLACLIEENHIHDDSCYVQPLMCVQSTEPHNHNESCYSIGTIHCSLPEGHVHGAECTRSELLCENIDESHQHADDCYVIYTECSIPENHIHDDSCYETIVVCGQEAGQVHEHTAECYSSEPECICGITEGHIHGENCYNKILVCQLPEDPGHMHCDDCYRWDMVLICGLEEGQTEPTEPADPVLICTEPVAMVHDHSDSCFEPAEEERESVDGSYFCGLEEHTHSLICYSDPEADVESPVVWEATFSHIARTGDWPRDLVAIAESQLGYTESSRNYTVWEDNSVHGYTRYGAWFGSPHGDWCAMFVSFCINYAGVEGMPLHWGVRPWIETLSDLNLYHPVGEYAPKSGDLIFYDWEGDGLSDHVGIVAEVLEAQEHTGARIKAIEGNSSNAVRYVYYDPEDPVILGYSELPAQEKETTVIEKTAVIYSNNTYETVAEEDTVITLTGSIPEAAEVRAYPVTLDTELDVICAYDITIFLPDGSVYEPGEGEVIDVCIQSSVLTDSASGLEVYHIPETGDPVLMESDVSEGAVNFDTGHFSVYAVTKNVGFSTKASIPGVETTVEFVSRTYSHANYRTLCAYKINITAHFSWGSQNPYWGTENMTVTITSDELAEEEKLLVFRIDDWGGVSEIPCTHNGSILEFITTPGNCVQGYFAVVAPPESIGSMTLSEDLVISEKMAITEDVTIDLNGYSIRTSADFQADAMFDVIGGSLTILDTSAADTASETSLNPLGAHLASTETTDSGILLNYYVTDSSVADSRVGATEEQVIQHTVTASGIIYGGSVPVIRVSNGTVNLEGGVLYGGTNHAIEANDGSEVNLTGGYICGFNTGSRGGAISIHGGTLTISDDAVIAGNHSDNEGGAVYASNCTVNMTGGVISGNTSSSAGASDGYGGGGIALNNAGMTMSGNSYVTNNAVLASGYWNGGGGIYTLGDSSIQITGGYVTGNQANAGGGIKTKDSWGGGRDSLQITGGYICSNMSTYSEGGGISIGAYDTGYISGGYINNNYADCRKDWGGGGVFVANDAYLQVIGALVTNNNAGGFGGGVAGCSTARMYITVDEGGAVYSNSAAGAHLSGDTSEKNEDWKYAFNSPVFMKYGFQDLFSALNCTVEGAMLGGGEVNWHGSCDGVSVATNSREDVIHSESVLGLTANPGGNAIAAAQAAATLYIHGNSSYTHGGGILCNGYLMMGRNGNMVLGARIEISASKSYVDQDGNEAAMSGGEFTFAIEHEDGTVVTTGSNTVNGVIVFEGRLPVADAGQYQYYIRENVGIIPGIEYDPTKYRMTITATETSHSSPFENTTVTQCVIDALQVEKWNSKTNTWEMYITSYNPGDSENGPIYVDLGQNTFVNVRSEVPSETKMTVKKVWSEPTDAVPVTVKLMQNGTIYQNGGEVTLSSDNDWMYTWENLPIMDQEGTAFEYTVEEDVLLEFDSVYHTGFLEADGSPLVTITNTRRTYGIEITKISNHTIPAKLEGAEFRIRMDDGQVLYFIKGTDGIYSPALPSAGDSASQLFTDEEGMLLISGLPAGIYTLEETNAPVGYELADPIRITLGGENMKDIRVYETDVVDRLMNYELPATGGIGTELIYAMGYLLVISAFAILIKRKKVLE